MKRTTTANLYNIEPRSPLIVYKLRHRGSYGADQPECFHIVRRQGYYDLSDQKKGIPELVTNCNRVMEFTTVFTGDEIPDSPYVKLCSRCGQRADFERALLEQQAASAKARQAYADAEANRRAEMNRAWEATLDALEDLQGIMETDEFKSLAKFKTGGRNVNASFNREEGTFVIEIDGVTLELIQTERKPENDKASRTTKTKVHQTKGKRTAEEATSQAVP